MNLSLLELLRCPFCGTRLSLEDNAAFARAGDQISSGVLGCECCAFPIVEGIPVLVADDATREAMHALEAGHREDARNRLLGLDAGRAREFDELLSTGSATYRRAVEVLSPDAEGVYFVYRFSDPTYVMAQAVVRAVGRDPRTLTRPAIDVCGGSGHLTRVIGAMKPKGGTVLADVFFWKLWLAARFTSPECMPVCCDANNPLPFARDRFSMVVLSDAFPYIWHKRLLADEMMRLAGPGGVIVMPHLHSARGENFSAGMTLHPESYRDLFAPQGARLFSDATLLTDILEHQRVDLAARVSPEELGTEPSMTLVASTRAEVFHAREVAMDDVASSTVIVNPLYRVERRGAASELTLSFPTEEYAEEFAECRRYLPETVTIDADLSGGITAEQVGAQYGELRRRRVLIDAPVGYV